MTTSSVSPLPGCGTFANQSTVAVSCTGIGEAFIKVVAAHQVSDRVRFSGENVEDAATATLDEVAAHHGDGGMIVLPAVGVVPLAVDPPDHCPVQMEQEQ